MRTVSWYHRLPRPWQHGQAPCPGTLRQVLLLVLVCGLGTLGALGHVCVAWGAMGRASDQESAQAHSVALTHLARAYPALGHADQAAQSLSTALQLALADQLGRDALTLARPLGQAELTATLLHTRGNLHLAQHHPQEALDVSRESTALAQQAQRTLLTDPTYADPFFWAPFLLINNWL